MTCTCGDCKCYECEYANASIDECIIAFIRDVGNRGWVNARGRFLSALRKKFQQSGFDCSEFLTNSSMSMAKKIRIEGHKIIQIDE